MSLRRIGLGFVLAATMGASTFAPVVYSVLATQLRAEFGVARWQIGALVAVVMGAGAVLSPRAGSFADRLEPRQSTALTLIVAGVGFLLMGAAPGYLALALASLAAGFAQAASNPATNLLIMTRAEEGRRGILTGIKQAGVQAGTFLGGIILPLGAASAFGWRGTVAAVAVVPALALLLVAGMTRGSGTTVSLSPSTVGPVPPVLFRLAVYAALVGGAGGALFTYLPSYGSETFGLTTEQAGRLVALFGGVAFVSRLSAGALSERFFGHHRTLAGMGLLTCGAGMIMALAPTASWLWPAALLIGMGPMAFNVVANLAVMELSPRGGAGRGSGVMMAGFLGGFAIGPPLLGASVDLLGTYRPGWWVTAGMGLVAVRVALGVRKPVPEQV